MKIPPLMINDINVHFYDNDHSDNVGHFILMIPKQMIITGNDGHYMAEEYVYMLITYIQMATLIVKTLMRVIMDDYHKKCLSE